ncbi:MAG: helix-turn-helix transcriptional regulator, partial [Acidobacteriota bacterium]
ARAYKKTRGRSVGEEIRRLQVRGAQAAVAQGEHSFAEIAVDCGFYDQSHMNRVFREFTGVTPGQYRDLVRGAARRGW